jgi:hypothetical protein
MGNFRSSDLRATMPISFRLATATFAFALSALCAPASPAVADGVTFDVIVSRHGVRSLTKPPVQYSWPEWSPVSAGFLTARGHKLMTYMGAFYRSYFASEGLTMCGPARSSYVYADHEQRPYETIHTSSFLHRRVSAGCRHRKERMRRLIAGRMPLATPGT